MPLRQLKGRLIVGFFIGLDRQDVQGVETICDPSPREASAPFSREQGVTYLQMPELWYKRAVLYKSFHHVVSSWHIFVIVEPRQNDRGINDERPHKRCPSWRDFSISSVVKGTRPHAARRRRNCSTASSLEARCCVGAGTICATGLPWRVMAIVSPLSTSLRSSAKRALASVALTSRMVPPTGCFNQNILTLAPACPQAPTLRGDC